VQQAVARAYDSLQRDEIAWPPLSKDTESSDLSAILTAENAKDAEL
jgi:hypothetical protein